MYKCSKIIKKKYPINHTVFAKIKSFHFDSFMITVTSKNLPRRDAVVRTLEIALAVSEDGSKTSG